MGAHRQLGLLCAGLLVVQLAAVAPSAVSASEGARAAEPTGAPSADERGRKKPVVTVNTHRRGPKASPRVIGSNHRFPFKGYGMWNTDTNAPDPRVVRGARRADINVLRYPGGSRANFFDWKEAIGPRDKRGCQVFGKLGAGKGIRALYGVREHMRFANMVGARTVITMPFMTETPRDAAAWVEFMNDAVGGRNPNGGKAWAAVRKKYGHPKPYNVRVWTIGNEPYLHNQRFWLGHNDGRALRRYVNGARIRYTKQQVGSECVFSSPDRRQQQQREILYPPLKPRSEKIFVKGTRWKRVKSVEQFGPKAKVYEVNNTTGKLTFGDGRHGKALPANPNVRATYTSVHAGFAQMRRAMKKADPSIRVCSEWSKPQFVRYMGQRGYDCLAAHPYRIFNIHFDGPLDAHDKMMAAERAASSLIPKLRRALRHVNRGNMPVIATEFGAITIPKQTEAPHWDHGMSDALFMASQVLGFVRRGVPLATGGALTSFNLRSTLGHKPSWTSSAWAVVTRQLSAAVHGGTVIGTRVARPPQRHAGSDSYPSLSTVSVRKGNRMHVVVVNRHPNNAVTADLRVRRANFAGKKIRIHTVVSAKPWTFNSPRKPHAVRAVTDTKRIRSQSPELRYRAHSVTVLSFRIR